MTSETGYQFLRLAVGSIVALTLQISFIPMIEIGAWRPDLIILVVIFIGFRYGTTQGIIAGFILGVLQDSFSPHPVGISAFADTIVGFLAGQVRQLKLAYNIRILALIILILIQTGLFFLIYQLQTDVGYLYLVATRVFPNTLYTFLIAILLSIFFRDQIEQR
jgi:rod shape-determining protein MreD